MSKGKAQMADKRSVQVELADINDRRVLHVADKKKTCFNVDLCPFSPIKMSSQTKKQVGVLRPEQS